MILQLQIVDLNHSITAKYLKKSGFTHDQSDSVLMIIMTMTMTLRIDKRAKGTKHKQIELTTVSATEKAIIILRYYWRVHMLSCSFLENDDISEVSKET